MPYRQPKTSVPIFPPLTRWERFVNLVVSWFPMTPPPKTPDEALKQSVRF